MYHVLKYSANSYFKVGTSFDQDKKNDYYACHRCGQRLTMLYLYLNLEIRNYILIPIYIQNSRYLKIHICICNIGYLQEIFRSLKKTIQKIETCSDPKSEF